MSLQGDDNPNLPRRLFHATLTMTYSPSTHPSTLSPPDAPTPPCATSTPYIIAAEDDSTLLSTPYPMTHHRGVDDAQILSVHLGGSYRAILFV
jgi:hypothetical protein